MTTDKSCNTEKSATPRRMVRTLVFLYLKRRFNCCLMNGTLQSLCDDIAIQFLVFVMISSIICFVGLILCFRSTF